MKKKLIARMLCTALMLAMVFSLTVPFTSAAGGTYYTDINDSSDVGRAVNYLYDHDIMKGPFLTSLSGRSKGIMIRNNMFYPNRAVTKMEFTLSLWKMLGKPEYYASSIKVTDAFDACTMQTKEDYRMAIRWAVGNGILDQAADGKYNPDSAMTMEEVLTMLYRFLNLCKYDTTFSRKTLLLGTPTTTESSNALRWAVSKKLIRYNADFLANCSRGNAAVYIYKIYELYQKKYGLTVVQTRDLPVATNNSGGMSNLFQSAGATVVNRTDIFFDAPSWYEGDTFIASMEEAFAKAKALDICYIYLDAHGSTEGLALFNYDPEIYPSGALTPKQLRAEIDKYTGTFVVFIESCYSGTFINKGINTESDSFDANAFVAELTNETGATTVKNADGGTLCSNSSRIKALCSSSQTEPSWFNSKWGYAVLEWLCGCGYLTYSNQVSEEKILADVNSDYKVSLHELYEYSLNEVPSRLNQHAVCYPENDNYIIFEIRDREFH